MERICQSSQSQPKSSLNSSTKLSSLKRMSSTRLPFGRSISITISIILLMSFNDAVYCVEARGGQPSDFTISDSEKGREP